MLQMMVREPMALQVINESLCFLFHIFHLQFEIKKNDTLIFHVLFDSFHFSNFLCGGVHNNKEAYGN